MMISLMRLLPTWSAMLIIFRMSTGKRDLSCKMLDMSAHFHFEGGRVQQPSGDLQWTSIYVYLEVPHVQSLTDG